MNPQSFKHPVRLSEDLIVPGLGLGCMGLTEFYGTDSREADANAVISRAIELGIPFLDTADAYGPWRNEEAVGRALRGRRHEVVLSSKFGVVRREDQGDGITGAICGRPNYVKAACDASLRRLGVDHLDLYFMHRPDPETPIEETAGALVDLVGAGKVRAIGFCEIGPALLRRAHAIHPVAAVQSEFSLWHRATAVLLPVLRELGVGLVAYSPLGRGFLSGKIRSLDDLAPDDWRRNSPRFQGDNFARNLAVVDRLKDIAARRGVTTAQLALAWIRAQADFIVPLSGATTVTQLEENAQSLEIQLDARELEEIEAASPRDAFAGESWPAGSVGARVDSVT
jgi:aryl-alcohol dehydrogenase-like predicted oxidoreductase